MGNGENGNKKVRLQVGEKTFGLKTIIAIGGAIGVIMAGATFIVRTKDAAEQVPKLETSIIALEKDADEKEDQIRALGEDIQDIQGDLNGAQEDLATIHDTVLWIRFRMENGDAP